MAYNNNYQSGYQNPNHQYQNNQGYQQQGYQQGYQQQGYQQQQQYQQTPNYNPYGNPPTQAWLNNDAFASGPSGKSRGLFALLAILLGEFGVHYFYIGKSMAGLLWLLGSLVIIPIITFITCGFGAVLYFVYLFPFIQGIILFFGNNQDFERKFVESSDMMPLF